MMSLYEIDRAILELLDPETGEITDWDAFEALQMDRDAKIENVACWYKNLVAEAAAIRQEELNLAKRRKAVESMAETRKRYLEEALGGQKFQTARCSVTFRKTSRVEVSDPATVTVFALAQGYENCITRKEPEVNKTELAKVLKAGVEIPGAELVAGCSMSVK